MDVAVPMPVVAEIITQVYLASVHIRKGCATTFINVFNYGHKASEDNMRTSMEK